ncbi:MAG: PDZ domain-containing protein [Pirellulales bacterium]
MKIAATDLEPVVWRTSDDPALGSFLVTSGNGDEPVAIGVMSVKARRFSAPSGLLGILLEQGEYGPQILRVVEGSAAEVAGLKPNDFVLQVDDLKVQTREALIETISNYRPGDKLKLIVKRGSQNLTISAILGRPETARPANADKGKNRRPDDERLAGDLSVRRGGFPTVLQHDTVLRPHQIGGPIVDLDGRAVGLNIARADRVSTYALPVKTVTTALTDLRAANCRPRSRFAVRTAIA